MINNFVELNEYLKQFIPGSIQDGDFYNPDKMYEILPLLGSPQEKLNIIHVAGTSGKTSTCYYIAGLLEQAGAKVGLTISPHIFQINERIQINLEPLEEKAMCELMNEFVSTPGLLELEPTYFELLIAFALWAFEKAGCTHAVLEVGLGGLKDATNVIKSPNKVCVITDIGLDHTRILGDTIEQIAYQKAGIIQPQNHAFCYEQSEVVNQVIDEQVKNQQAILHRFDQNDLAKNAHFVLDLPLYQKRNWLLAKQVADYVIKRDSLSTLNNEQEAATQKLIIPGRMQLVEVKGKHIVLDGAHNPQKLQAFVNALQSNFPDQSFTLLIAFMESKQATLSESLQLLRRLSDSVIITEFATSSDLPHKVIPASQLAKYCEQAGFDTIIIEPNAEKAFDQLLQHTADVYVATGSFYLIGSLQPAIKEYL